MAGGRRVYGKKLVVREILSIIFNRALTTQKGWLCLLLFPRSISSSRPSSSTLRRDGSRAAIACRKYFPGGRSLGKKKKRESADN